MTAAAVRTFRSSRGALEVLFVALALPAAGSASPAAANEDDVYSVQTNASGDNVPVIDPATNEIVADTKTLKVRNVLLFF